MFIHTGDKMSPTIVAVGGIEYSLGGIAHTNEVFNTANVVLSTLASKSTATNCRRYRRFVNGDKISLYYNLSPVPATCCMSPVWARLYTLQLTLNLLAAAGHASLAQATLMKNDASLLRLLLLLLLWFIKSDLTDDSSQPISNLLARAETAHDASWYHQRRWWATNESLLSMGPSMWYWLVSSNPANNSIHYVKKVGRLNVTGNGFFVSNFFFALWPSSNSACCQLPTLSMHLIFSSSLYRFFNLEMIIF